MSVFSLLAADCACTGFSQRLGVSTTSWTQPAFLLPANESTDRRIQQSRRCTTCSKAFADRVNLNRRRLCARQGWPGAPVQVTVLLLAACGGGDGSRTEPAIPSKSAPWRPAAIRCPTACVLWTRSSPRPPATRQIPLHGSSSDAAFASTGRVESSATAARDFTGQGRRSRPRSAQWSTSAFRAHGVTGGSTAYPARHRPGGPGSDWLAPNPPGRLLQCIRRCRQAQRPGRHGTPGRPHL